MGVFRVDDCRDRIAAAVLGHTLEVGKGADGDFDDTQVPGGKMQKYCRCIDLIIRFVLLHSNAGSPDQPYSA